jgi:hypothetical protein
MNIEDKECGQPYYLLLLLQLIDFIYLYILLLLANMPMRCNGETIIVLSMAQEQLHSEALCEHSGHDNMST